MAKVSAELKNEIDALLGGRRLAMAELGDRRVVLQVVDDEVDLDALIDGNPLLAPRIEEGLRAAERADVAEHGEVVQANLRRP